MHQKPLFGTDGIRGRTGLEPVTPDFVLRLGWATGCIMKPPGASRCTILVGKDTRRSCSMLESALAAGLAAAGVDCLVVGILPTSAISCLVSGYAAAGGIVISASHNSYLDNGIKLFTANGRKASKSIETRIESCLQRQMRIAPTPELGTVSAATTAEERYIEFCKNSVSAGFSLAGLKIVLDCANGACYRVAPEVLRALDAKVELIGSTPDGLNINHHCGTTDPLGLQANVRQLGADFGIAFDGDGDRLLMTDCQGNILDGDDILMLIASHRQLDSRLRGGVVGTLMTNLGLEEAFSRMRIPFARVPIGDWYVAEYLDTHDWFLGGEPSGHIICRDKAPTSDGLIAALQALEAWIATMPGSHVHHRKWNRFPQITRNVPLPDGIALAADQVLCHPQMTAAVADIKAMLGKPCQVLLRKSGTEAVIRVMVEGVRENLVEQCAGQLADRIATLLARENTISFPDPGVSVPRM